MITHHAVSTLFPYPGVVGFSRYQATQSRTRRYSTTGSSYTYKILADWRVNDWLLFRDVYNRAERSPNMAELYLAPEIIFNPFDNLKGDPCAYGNSNPYSANPDINPNWANVVALCGQMMEASGDLEG